VKEQYFWFANVRHYVLSSHRERELKPGKAFTECQHCPEMVVVPAGRFDMGSPVGKGQNEEEHPQHPVSIAAPFAASRYEVTFEQWDDCAATGGCRQLNALWGRGNQPVVNVSWYEAKRYVGWLSRVTGKEYRLLSEAEWEYAARAGTTTRYSFGDDEAALSGHAWYGGNSERRAHPVGRKTPNGFGLFDMHGNVWEWVEDNWHPNYLAAPADGSVWRSDRPLRVLRGGSWISRPGDLRSAFRYYGQPDYRDDWIGFRVARTLSPRPARHQARPVTFIPAIEARPASGHAYRYRSQRL
jgi:formylglycine-generating enzyme required for sulfatase activity